MFFDDIATLNQQALPSDNFELNDWKLTLPVNSSGGTSGKAAEVKNLIGYDNPKFFDTGADGALVFTAPVKGATTSGSHYTRSELREMDGTSLADWTLDEGGTMTAELAVNRVPKKSDGSAGRVVIGQVHGEDEELCRLYYDKNTVYFMDDLAGSKGVETKFAILDAAGNKPNISLNEHFEYRIDVTDSLLTVSVYADGKVYRGVDPISSHWQDDNFYFKAGVYNGVGASGSGAGTIGTGTGQASFYRLEVSH